MRIMDANTLSAAARKSAESSLRLRQRRSQPADTDLICHRQACPEGSTAMMGIARTPWS
jgi:hypothetical protein